MVDVSIVIPARKETYLQQTVNDLFAKAHGSIEVIVVLDGYWPNPILEDNNNLILIHNTEAQGMRSAINSAAEISKGKWLMKCDAHCMFANGYDTVLKEYCDADTLAVPSRYGLDVETWKPKDDKPPVEYLYMTFPYIKEDQFGWGFHGKKLTDGNIGPKAWWGPETRLKDKKIDEIMIWQGSCWIMHRRTFFEIDMLDTMYSYNMFQEANELAMKFWLSGRKLIVNKNTWYAHWHKPTGTNNGFGLSNRLKRQTESMSAWFWMNNKWPKRTRDFTWYVERFWPIPTWPANWQEMKLQAEREFPEVWGDSCFQPIDKDGHNGLGV